MYLCFKDHGEKINERGAIWKGKTISMNFEISRMEQILRACSRGKFPQVIIIKGIFSVRHVI